MMAEKPPGHKRRILAVEDEFLLSVMLAEDLRGAGFEVVGPFGTLPDAMEAARREAFDFAVLDINIRGTMVYPLAEKILDSGIPFVFLTGYLGADIPPRFSAIPRVPKPYEAHVLLRQIDASLAAAEERTGRD